MQTKKKAFTLVEMIVAMAVSTIIIAGAYASYDMVKTQYTKNLDLSQMQQSGRAIMQMIERDARMAGFEYLDEDANMTYGKISSPLTIKDSGNKCCDELTVIYDYVDDVLDWKGRLVSSSVNRIRVRYWTEAFTSKKGDRFRLYKQKDILGKSNVLLTKPIIGNKEVMADFIEDLQFINILTTGTLYSGARGNNYIKIFDPTKPRNQKHTGYIRNAGYIDALAFGPDGLLYAGSRGTNTIDIWDLTKPINQKKVNYIRNSGYVDALAFGPDGLLYAGSRGTNTIKIFDPTKPRSQKEVATIRNSGYVNALAFGPDRLLYAGSSGTNVINIWDPTKPKNQKGVGSIRNSGYVDALAFGPGGLLYAGSSGTNTISIWNPTKPRNQKRVGTIHNSGYVDALAFGPGGLLYAGSSGNNVFNIWDPNNFPKNLEIRKIDNYIRNSGYTDALVFKTKSTGQESLLTINLTLRAKEKYGKIRQYLKKDYTEGNFAIDKTDNYKRDTFSTKVLVRNMML